MERLRLSCYGSSIEYVSWQLEDGIRDRLYALRPWWACRCIALSDSPIPAVVSRELQVGQAILSYQRAAQAQQGFDYDPRTPEGIQRLLDDRRTAVERLSLAFEHWEPFATVRLREGRVVSARSWELPIRPADAGLIRQQCPSWERVATGADAEVVVDAAAEFVRAVFRYRA